MNPHQLLTDPKQIETVRSIRRLDKEGYLYHMNCTYNYYDLPQPFQAMIDAGCSVFLTKNTEGDWLYCRNYDYSHYPMNQRKNERTGLNFVVEGHNPEAKYKSIGAADAYWIDFQNGSLAKGMADDGKTDLSPFILCPYLCMDGMNEKGFAVSILALSVESDWQEIPFDTYKEVLNENKNNFFLEKAGEVPSPYLLRAQNGSVAVNESDQKAWLSHQRWVETKAPGKQTLLHPILMRLLLDNCATVEEAIAFAGQYNVKAAMPGADYHLFIADRSGASKVLEWIGDDLVVTDINHTTNSYVAKKDLFLDRCPRDTILEGGLLRTKDAGMREDFLMHLLGLVIQDPTNGIDQSKTQYTCIYNLTKGTVRVFSYGDLSQHWDFSL